MRRSKFSDAQIALVLRQAGEGAPSSEVCCKAGIAEVTFFHDDFGKPGALKCAEKIAPFFAN